MKCFLLLAVVSSLVCAAELGATSPNTSAEFSTCPTWFSNGSDGCECGASDTSIKNIVTCDNQTDQTQLLSCFCLTYEYDSDNHTAWRNPVIGPCLIGCLYHTEPNTPYRNLPSEVPKLFNDTCGRFNRDNRLCGNCTKGYSRPFYLHSEMCVQCSSKHAFRDWLKYIVIAYLPLTLFFVIVIFFGINFNAPPWKGFVIVCQVLSTHEQLYIITSSLAIPIEERKQSSGFWAVRNVLPFYGIWNLDFFSMLYSPFCAYSGGRIGSLGHLALRYVNAFYPLLLILFTYGFVVLHDRYGLPSCLTRAISRCSGLRGRLISWFAERDIRSSLIKAFSSFIFLSSFKLLKISCDLLVPVYTYDMNGNKSENAYLYFDATIDYFGRQHTSYGIFAIVVAVLFGILPMMLLFLYPCRCFKASKCCNKRFLLVLYVYMESFHGWYKNRSESKIDYRFFSGVYFLVQFLFVFVYLCFFSAMAYLLIAITLIVVSVFIVFLKPLREEKYNIMNAALFLSTALFYIFVYIGLTATRETFIFTASIQPYLIGFLALVPMFSFVLYLCYYAFFERQVHLPVYNALYKRLSSRFRRYGRRVFSESLPYRMKSRCNTDISLIQTNSVSLQTVTVSTSESQPLIS